MHAAMHACLCSSEHVSMPHTLAAHPAAVRPAPPPLPLQPQVWAPFALWILPHSPVSMSAGVGLGPILHAMPPVQLKS